MEEGPASKLTYVVKFGGRRGAQPSPCRRLPAPAAPEAVCHSFLPCGCADMAAGFHRARRGREGSRETGTAVPHRCGVITHNHIWEGTQKSEFIYENCVFILTRLNFSHRPRTLHLMPHTQRDIFPRGSKQVLTSMILMPL